MNLGKVEHVNLGIGTTTLFMETGIKLRIPLQNLSFLVGEELSLGTESNHILWRGKAIAAVTSGILECFAYPKALEHERKKKEDE